MFVNNTELLNKLLQLEIKIDQNKHKNDNVHTLIESIEQKLTNIDSNINHIYFENQIIKHQLLLEDCIRESVNEIDDLSLLIKDTVYKINKLTEISKGPIIATTSDY
jgi:hypothetical protein